MKLSTRRTGQDLRDPAVLQQQLEIRRLSERNRALKEIERLRRNGRPVPPLLYKQAFPTEE